MKLSRERAEAVRTYLVSHGLPADRVRAEGAGKADPIADNATPEGRANNRRVEITLENAKAGGGEGEAVTTNPEHAAPLSARRARTPGRRAGTDD